MLSTSKLTLLLPLLCTLSLSNALPRMEEPILNDPDAIVTLKTVQKVAISTGADGSTATVFDTTTADAEEATSAESGMSTSTTSNTTAESASTTVGSATASSVSSASESAPTDPPTSILSVATIETDSVDSTTSSDIPDTINTETVKSTSTDSATTSATSAARETSATISSTSANESTSTIVTSASVSTDVTVTQSPGVTNSTNKTTSDLVAAQTAIPSGEQALTANSTTTAGSDSVGKVTTENDSCTRGARQCRDNVMFLCNYITPPPDLSVVNSSLPALVFLLLSFTAIASPIADGQDTNAYKLDRGLPLKKPRTPFNPSKTAVKRQQPSGASQTGNFAVTYDDDPLRKRDGPMYLVFASDLGSLEVTTYNTSTSTWTNLYNAMLGTGTSGYDVTIISLSSDFTGYSTYKQSASGAISYDYKAADSAFDYSLQMWVGEFGDFPAVAGAYPIDDLELAGIYNSRPITITFIPGYFKVPGTGAYSGGTVQYYDSTAQTWKGLATLKIDAGASGYDMTYLALTTPSTLYKQSASGVLSYLWLAPTSPDTFTPSMFVGNHGGYPMVAGAYASSGLTTFGVTDVQPITITFTQFEG
uniref:Uncharacterized protein n=1 Tax=Kwoniella bestiolae CBS 10118 TaxID=1296100 RepID=A0A1B9G3K5_9TREE|nr:hypothetical protein I302_05461 [Kwoniella bestiolae CBS 10118]OCF25637.1 hypothetical protein I302_05461 [Kwoniella bestiolae CBS 10118]